MEFLTVILLATAISFDGLGVGVAYGVKGIDFPVKSRFMVAAISTCVISAAFFLGGGLRVILPENVNIFFGKGVFILVGIWFLLQAWVRKQENEVKEENLPLARFSFKSLGIIILVLRHPSSADFDHSGVISLQEALVVGLALAMDAMGAGIGAAVGRNWPYYTPLAVGFMKLIILSAGLYLGKIGRKHTRNTRRFEPVLAYLPGAILIFLAVTGI